MNTNLANKHSIEQSITIDLLIVNISITSLLTCFSYLCDYSNSKWI